jgi:hypothetical protein
MANAASVKLAYYNSLANDITGKFQRLNNLVDNRVANGSYHEEIVRALLRNFLTKRYSIKTGFIYRDDQHISKQLDIIIVDEHTPAAYIFQEGDFAIVLPVAVVGYIEVKTTFSAKEFVSSIENIASAKHLMDSPYDSFGAIFGYQTDAPPNDEKIGNWFRKSSLGKLRSTSQTFGPDALILFKDNYSLFHYSPVTKLIGDGLDYHRFKSSAEDELGWQISILLAMIINSCERNSNGSIIRLGLSQANSLVGSGGLDISSDEFVLGLGKQKSGPNT